MHLIKPFKDMGEQYSNAWQQVLTQPKTLPGRGASGAISLSPSRVAPPSPTGNAKPPKASNTIFTRNTAPTPQTKSDHEEPMLPVISLSSLGGNSSNRMGRKPSQKGTGTTSFHLPSLGVSR